MINNICTEKLSAHLQLVPFEKHVLLLLSANVLSPKISPNGMFKEGEVNKKREREGKRGGREEEERGGRGLNHSAGGYDSRSVDSFRRRADHRPLL